MKGVWQKAWSIFAKEKCLNGFVVTQDSESAGRRCCIKGKGVITYSLLSGESSRGEGSPPSPFYLSVQVLIPKIVHSTASTSEKQGPCPEQCYHLYVREASCRGCKGYGPKTRPSKQPCACRIQDSMLCHMVLDNWILWPLPSILYLSLGMGVPERGTGISAGGIFQDKKIHKLAVRLARRK